VNHINHRSCGAHGNRQAARAPRFTSVALFVGLLFGASLFGQSAAPETQVHTFHVQGTIRDYAARGVAGIEVIFEGEGIRKIVSSDENAFYAADLPVGLYRMTVEPQREFPEYQRPLFRVTSSTTLTFNITIDLGERSCDLGVSMGGSSSNQFDTRNACGGSDSFMVPSRDHVPFELSIQFGRRHPTDHENIYDGVMNYNTGRSYVYASGWNPPTSGPVLAFYNLFTLQANHVVYDVENRKLTATGKVVMLNTDGSTRHADAMAFKIENGEAIPLP
jgi:hypothetical protein